MNRIGNNLVHYGGNEELVHALIRCRVDFILIGGLAVAWYCETREADDMDILVDPTEENSAKIAKMLLSLGIVGEFDSRSFMRLGVQVPLKHRHYAELLTPHPQGLSYSEVVATATDVCLFNVPVKAASPAALIQMKRLAIETSGAQCDKHRADIACLQQYAA